MNRTDISTSRRQSAVDKVVILRETPYLDRRRTQRASKNGQENWEGGFTRQTQKLHWEYDTVRCILNERIALLPISSA